MFYLTLGSSNDLLNNLLILLHCYIRVVTKDRFHRNAGERNTIVKFKVET